MNYCLTVEEKKYLQHQLKFHQHPDIRERVLVLLLRNQGMTQQEIADLIGCSVRKVAYWSTHGDPRNVESLVDKRMQGNYRKTNDEYVSLLIRVVETNPKELGYSFRQWSQQKLADHLATQTGIKLSSSQIGRILKTHHQAYNSKIAPYLRKSTALP